MTTLSIDVETYSSVSLADAGAYKYAESDDFEILLFGYSVDDGEVEVVDIAGGQRMPKDILSMLTDPSVLKTAYNAQFERTAIARYFALPMPPEQWSCSMVLAAQAGLPFGLDAVCKALGLPPDETKADGRALIRYFSQPCRPTIANGGRTRNMPWDDYDRWDRYKAYNKRDVEVENTVRRRLINLMPTEEEQKFWQLDQRINDRGVKLDLEMIRNAIDMSESYTKALTAKAIRLSGITNVKSQQQIKAWLESVEGESIESLNKKAMPDVLAKLKTEEAKEFLDLRAELSKTSVAKFEKMQVCACKDDHARGLFQFYGAARTGRFSGRLIQLQNLPQNHLADLAEVRSLVKAGSYEELSERHPNINSTLSELIRTAIIPEDGCRFIVADFSAIEARVIAWFAHEEADLEEFRGAGKIYELTASRMFGVPKERIAKGNPEYALRAKGKVATLACGYGGGVKALITMGALRSGIPEEELPSLVRQWRSAHANIVAWWHSLEDAAMRSIRTKSIAVDEIGNVKFDFVRNNLHLYLPSGRKLTYVNATTGTNRFGNASIMYAGQNQVTHKWEMLETYGGKLAENVVQSTARDCLRDSMMNLADAGFDIRMHVHDEVIINEPIGGRTLEEVIARMRQSPSWAEGLPLNAAGFVSDFYMKD